MKPKDFQSDDWSVLALNATTSMEVGRVQNNLMLVNGDEIEVLFPKKSMSVGHSLILHFVSIREFNRTLKKDLSDVKGIVVASSKVLEVVPNENKIVVRLQLLQFDREAWEKLKKEFSAKQEKMDEMMSKMKGKAS